MLSVSTYPREIISSGFHCNFKYFRKENSIEVIEIDRAWLSDPAVIGSPKTSSVVAQLPKDLNGAASIVVGNQMIIFGGLSTNQVSNPDIIIFNIDNSNVSTLPSVFASMTFGQKTYFVSKGNYLVIHLRF
jgi:hypothetical protein